MNDAPSFTKGADQTVLEDAGAQSVSGWATAISAGPNESGQTVTFEVTGNTNAGAVLRGAGVSPTGTLTYTPAANQNGTRDDHAENHRRRRHRERRREPAPRRRSSSRSPRSTTRRASPRAPTRPSPRTQARRPSPAGRPRSAPARRTRPARPSPFEITDNTNAGLFSAGPSVSPTGTLTYTPAANQNGTATITLRITDNGGTANGGVNASATQTFVITVTAVNDAPVAQAKSYAAQTNMKITGLGGLLTGVTDADTGVNGCTPTLHGRLGRPDHHPGRRHDLQRQRRGRDVRLRPAPRRDRQRHLLLHRAPTPAAPAPPPAPRRRSPSTSQGR